MSHIEDNFIMKSVASPKQFESVPTCLIPKLEVKYHPYDHFGIKKEMHEVVRNIKRSKYTSDGNKDVWKPNIEGDCEDKCLHFVKCFEDSIIFESLRLAICEIDAGQHAVLLLYTEEGTKVIDPTLSTMIVDWEKYPVKRWIMVHNKWFVWKKFCQSVST